MNGLYSRGRDISAHEIVSTMGKKIANWTEGNSIYSAHVAATPDAGAEGQDKVGDHAERWRSRPPRRGGWLRARPRACVRPDADAVS